MLLSTKTNTSNALNDFLKKSIQIKLMKNLLIRYYLPNHVHVLYITEKKFTQQTKYKFLLYSYFREMALQSFTSDLDTLTCVILK